MSFMFHPICSDCSDSGKLLFRTYKGKAFCKSCWEALDPKVQFELQYGASPFTKDQPNEQARRKFEENASARRKSP